jgi:predicted N-acetyltransferase YhbS
LWNEFLLVKDRKMEALENTIELAVRQPLAISAETAADIPARDALLDRAMGPRWRKKSSEKLRKGRIPSEGLALIARDASGAVIGTVRLWDVAMDAAFTPLAGAGPAEGQEWGEVDITRCASLRPAPPPERGRKKALLLGPLAVEPTLKGAGIGSALMRQAVSEARRLGHAAIILVGDAPYYARFGFSAEKTAALAMPGPYEKHRLLARELAPGALDGAHGVIRPTGRKIKRARFARAV